MTKTAKAKAVPTLRQQAEAVAARLETEYAAADAILETYLESLRADGVPKTSTDALFWARVPQHDRLLALRAVLASPYV